MERCVYIYINLYTIIHSFKIKTHFYNSECQSVLLRFQLISLTGTIRGTSCERLFQELGLEPLKLRHWFRKLNLFYKISKKNLPRVSFRYFRQSITSVLQEVFKAATSRVSRSDLILPKIHFSQQL